VRADYPYLVNDIKRPEKAKHRLSVSKATLYRTQHNQFIIASIFVYCSGLATDRVNICSRKSANPGLNCQCILTSIPRGEIYLVRN